MKLAAEDLGSWGRAKIAMDKAQQTKRYQLDLFLEKGPKTRSIPA